MDVTRFVDDRPEDGVFRVNRAIFTDQEVFEREIEQIFESGWVFLGIESQAENPHDFFTTTMGRVPVMVQRDGEGTLRGFASPMKGSKRQSSQPCTSCKGCGTCTARTDGVMGCTFSTSTRSALTCRPRRVAQG